MKRITRIALLSAMVVFTATSRGNNAKLPLIPYPQKVEQLKAEKVSFKKLVILADEDHSTNLSGAIAQLNRFVPALQFTTNAPQKGYITVSLLKETSIPKEGYKLKIEGNKVSITYSDNGGCFYAFQTLMQLMEKKGKAYTLPQVAIEDSPNFMFRGFMHDVGRNFQTIEDLKRQLDIFALYKLNVFHWHLTDHPGWRIECKAYPILNDPTYQRKGRDQGTFYTYDQIRDLIAYAKERNILVIPEIDVPGHSAFFKTAFGFTMASPQGIEVLEKCFKEFFSEIPASDCPYIHLGSDEVHIDNPKEFMAKMEDLVYQLGRKAVVWNPGLKASPATINQIWKDAAFTSEDKQNDVNLSSPLFDSSIGYVNGYDPLILVNRIILNKACGKVKGDSLALGGILCCWPDVKVADKKNIFRHNPVWPATLAFAERYWHGGELPFVKNPNLLELSNIEMRNNLEDFEKRMDVHKTGILASEPFPWTANSTIQWNVSIPFKSKEEHTAKSTTKALASLPDSLRWVSYSGGTIDMEALKRAYKVEGKDSLVAYAYAYIYSDKSKTVDCWIGFETPARSNRQYAGIPQQGSWDANGGDVWINGSRLTPPVWSKPGQYRILRPTWAQPEEEMPYEDEEFYWSRKPTKVHLQKGKNVVLIKVPKSYQAQRWSFTFAPLNMDGLRFTTKEN